MVKSLENLGIVPLQFRLDSHRPDLTKVDTLLGLLASECSFFPIQVGAVAKALHEADCKLEAALEQMKDLPFPEELSPKNECVCSLGAVSVQPPLNIHISQGSGA